VSSRSPSCASKSLLGFILVSRAREAAYLSASSLAQRLGMRPVVAHCHLGLGRLCAHTGDSTAAGRELDTALALYRELGIAYWPEQVKALLQGLR
jgi:hypothetical protein